MSPVLLDHRNLKWIWLSVGLLVFATFFGGYIMGFEKSNSKWLAKLDPVEIALPKAIVSDLIAVEAQTPEFEEPGASIDVDSADSDADIAKVTGMKTAVVKKANAEEITVIPLEVVETGLAVETRVEEVNESDLPIKDPETALLSDQSKVPLSIVDDATEDTARYSIQVAMYKSFDNAVTKVEELVHTGLSAYLQDYKNKNDETRYNVRFGYFNSFSNARQALHFYEQSYSDSGYIARINR